MQTSKLKRQLKRSICTILATALVVSALPGQAKSKTTVSAIQITSPLSQTGSQVSATLTMKKGSQFRIKTRILPTSAKKTALSYKSSKKKIASVSTKGVIRANNKGNATITISPKGNKKVKAVIKVTVKDSLKKVKKIRLDQNSIALSLDKENNSAKLKAVIISPKKPTNTKINWISNDSNIASVNRSGLVTATGTGSTDIIAAAADGQGAKAICHVTVSEKDDGDPTISSPSPSDNAPNNPTDSSTPANPSGPENPTQSPPASLAPDSSLTPNPSLTPDPSLVPSSSPSSNPTIEKEAINIVIPDDRTGIKQGERIQLSAKGVISGNTRTDVTWSTSSLAGVSISENGLLTVTQDTEASKKITITAALKSDPTFQNKVSLTTVENNSVLRDNHIQLNNNTEENPQGLEYRTDNDGTKACTTVPDPMRGSVTRIDESIGYKNDMIAWMLVDPMYAGKEVHMSAYIKYDKLPTRDTIGLVLNERWNYSNPVVKWNAEPDTWYYIEGTFTLPDYRANRYDGTKNNLFLSRFSELNDDEHPVYYLDNLVFSIEKAEVESVTLSIDKNAETIYQNHTLQCSAEVTGTNNPMQKVAYTIEPAVENVSISEDGLLTVGNAPADSKINIKATSIEDSKKYDIKTITVLAQTIDSMRITAPDDATEIFQDSKMQLEAVVDATGEPDTSVNWAISPAVEGASISEEGLLTVGKVAGETELHITATSVFNSSKSTEYTVTVKANTVNNVTITSAGDKTTISPGTPLNLFADVDVTGPLSKNVTWSIPIPVEGATLSPSGNNCTLSISDQVAIGTQITIKAVSTSDPSKDDEFTVTVENASSTDEFDLNKLSCEYWEDFSTTKTVAALEEGGVVSYLGTTPETSTGLWNNFKYTQFVAAGGVHIMDDSLIISKKRTRGMNYHFGSQDDYLQFAICNDGTQEKSYTLSFMFRFTDIATDGNVSSVTYKLPLKLIALDENDNETILKDSIQIPYHCNALSTAYNKEFYEIFSTVNVPAGKTIRLQLKLNGALPTCQIPDSHTNAENEPHPIVYTIDNIAISSGVPTTISIKKGDTYQLALDTLSTDTVEYYTNCELAQYTHDDDDDSELTCTRFDTIIANVNADGLISAITPGDTTLIAVITHEDGTIDRKQCIIHVEE